jgi:hypothetical protein
MHEVQKPQLYVDEEQEDYDGAAGVQEILQPLPCAYAAQRDSMIEGSGGMELFVQASSSNGRAAVSKTACWGFESLLACQFQIAVPAEKAGDTFAELGK